MAGDVGFKYSLLGKPANNNTNVKEIGFASNFQTLKTFKSGVVSKACSSLTTTTIQVAHGLGYRPAFNAYYKSPNTISQTLSSNTVAVKGGTGTVGEDGQAHAQSFQAIQTGTLTSVDLSLLKTGSPNDNLVVDIVSTLGGTSLSTGSIAASSASGIKNISLTPVNLTSGNTYYIQVTRSGSRDTSNLVNLLLKFGTNPYTHGEGFNRDNNVWAADGTSSDYYFVLYFGDIDVFQVMSGFEDITLGRNGTTIGVHGSADNYNINFDIFNTEDITKNVDIFYEIFFEDVTTEPIKSVG